MASDTVPFEVFRDELRRHVGVKRAQMIFCEQTGYSISTFYHWQRQQAVPKEAFGKIADIEIGACDTKRFKGYHTQKFFNRVVELSNKNTPIKEMAKRLAVERGRKVNERAIKSARDRMKDRIPGYKTRGAGPEDVAEYQERVAAKQASS